MIKMLCCFFWLFSPLLYSIERPLYKPNTLTPVARSSLEARGVQVPFAMIPSNFIINIDCNFYDLDMLLIAKLEGYLCKSFNYEAKKWFFFKEQQQYMLASTQDKLTLYDQKLNPLWSVSGLFSHDFIFKEDSKEIIAIVADKRLINGEEYQYFGLNSYSLSGELIWSWSSFDIMNQLEKIGEWKVDPNGVRFPLSARNHKRNKVLELNWLIVLEEAWPVKNGPTLSRGSLIFHENYTNALIVLSEDFKVVWSFRFDLKQKDGVKTGNIHTPILLDDGIIAVYDNMIELPDGSISSGISYFNSANEGVKTVKYIIPKLYESQFSSERGFGSLQRLSNGEWFISTGTEYGGVIHLSSDFKELFRWVNPIVEQVNVEGKNIEKPMPVYRGMYMDRAFFKKILSF